MSDTPVTSDNSVLGTPPDDAQMSDSSHCEQALRIAIVAQLVYFEQYVAEMSKELSRLGHEVSVLPEIPIGSWDVILIVGIHLFPNVPFLSRAVIAGIQTEQLPTGDRAAQGRLKRNLNRFHAVRRYYDVIYEWNPALFALGFGGNVFLPYGCLAGNDQEFVKEFDVAFIGNIHHSPRRQRILESLRSKFNFYPDYSPGFGDRRQQAINSSRILLNIHFYDEAGLESPRMFDYLSSGAFVISEATSQSYPFQAGRDFVSFRDETELVRLIEEFRYDEEKRAVIARQGFETSQRFTYARCAELLSIDLLRQWNFRRSPLHRIPYWIASQLRCWWFDFRDNVSQRKRNVWGGKQ